MTDLTDNPLGKHTDYPSQYDASVLFPIARSQGRESAGISEPLPFMGFDNWTAYEVSWLDGTGKPVVAIGHFSFDCNSPNIVESKSFKLYLNSFNLSRFDRREELEATMLRDLSAASGMPTRVNLLVLEHAAHMVTHWPQHQLLDEYPLLTMAAQPDANLLEAGEFEVKAKWQSHLFRSLCPVTAQPDWASIRIEYNGQEIEPSSLLSYLLAYRSHQGFHEQCVEQIFRDLLAATAPASLLIEARFLRRGGLDINPLRMKGVFEVNQTRLSRQ